MRKSPSAAAGDRAADVGQHGVVQRAHTLGAEIAMSDDHELTVIVEDPPRRERELV